MSQYSGDIANATALSVSGCDLFLLKDSGNVSNPFSSLLSVASYNFTAYCTAEANYSGANATFWLSVKDASALGNAGVGFSPFTSLGLITGAVVTKARENWLPLLLLLLALLAWWYYRREGGGNPFVYPEVEEDVV